jgi:hypothetical protein
MADQETSRRQGASKSTDQERWSDIFGVLVKGKCVISVVVGQNLMRFNSVKVTAGVILTLSDS